LFAAVAVDGMATKKSFFLWFVIKNKTDPKSGNIKFNSHTRMMLLKNLYFYHSLLGQKSEEFNHVEDISDVAIMRLVLPGVAKLVSDFHFNAIRARNFPPFVSAH
jgi:hypothetical protein